MSIITFCLGLAIGIGFWLRRQASLYLHLEQILDLLQLNAAEEASLPIVSRLRRGVAISKQQRQQLQQELQSWQELLQGAPLGYLHIDEENQLVWCNEQAQDLLQISRWEPGQIRLLLELVRCYELDRLIEKTRDRQEPIQLEWVFHPAIPKATFYEVTPQINNTPLTLRAFTVPLHYGQVGVFLENRQPFIELSHSRDRWVSDLAHELRTPLTSIRLVAETLQKRLDPPLSGWVERLLQETNRLINLVQHFLELSRLEEEPSKYLNLKPVELGALIQSVWQTLDPFVQQKQLSLSYSETAPLWLQADASRLTQVFLNLFDNSIKYSPPEGVIQVEVDRHNESKVIEINIIDSGSGFDESDLPHVFDRLYRGDLSRQRQAVSPGSPETSIISTGSGLGLAIVRQIILVHGGTITANNHPETGGAWLQIKFP